MTTLFLLAALAMQPQPRSVHPSIAKAVELAGSVGTEAVRPTDRIDLELRVVGPDAVKVGDVVKIGLYAVASPLTAEKRTCYRAGTAAAAQTRACMKHADCERGERCGEPFSVLDAVVQYDPCVLGWDEGALRTGSFAWGNRGAIVYNDHWLDGWNDDLHDGDFYLTFHGNPNDFPVATPEGFLVCTLTFKVLRPFDRTQVGLLANGGAHMGSTRVFYSLFGYDITGRVVPALLKFVDEPAAVGLDLDHDGDVDADDLELFFTLGSKRGLSCRDAQRVLWKVFDECKVWKVAGDFARLMTGPDGRVKIGVTPNGNESLKPVEETNPNWVAGCAKIDVNADNDVDLRDYAQWEVERSALPK